MTLLYHPKMIKTTFHHIQVTFQNIAFLIFQHTSMFLLLHFLQNTTFIKNKLRFHHIIILSSSFLIKTHYFFRTHFYYPHCTTCFIAQKHDILINKTMQDLQLAQG